MEDATPTQRPKRLWVAAVLNILIGSLAVIFIVFLATSARVPEAARPGLVNLIAGGFLGCLLVFYSVLALKGRPSARRNLLIVATVYFGATIAQNAAPLLGLSDSIVPSQKLIANVVRHSLTLGITWWALTSSVTMRFFAMRPLPPSNALERTRGG